MKRCCIQECHRKSKTLCFRSAASAILVFTKTLLLLFGLRVYFLFLFFGRSEKHLVFVFFFKHRCDVRFVIFLPAGEVSARFSKES